MEKLVIASTRKSAGKTSLIAGIARVMDRKARYIKPLGDRLLYRKKRSWDYDAAVITHLLNSKDNPEEVTVGFEHAKLRYVYNRETIGERLHHIAGKGNDETDVLFVECGKDLTYGSSICLDAVSIAKNLDAKIIFIVSGNDNTVIDDVNFIKKRMDMNGTKLGGVIINKVHDEEEFRNVHYARLEQRGVPLLGLLPFVYDLTYFTMDYLAEHLFAKVLSGGRGIFNVVKNIFVGAMSANTALRNPLFDREKKLVITSGDRSDMIITALHSDTSGILLTNNMLPPSGVIAKASEMNIPLLLVSGDIYTTASRIEAMEPLLTRNNERSIQLLEDMVRKNLKLDGLL